MLLTEIYIKNLRVLTPLRLPERGPSRLRMSDPPPPPPCITYGKISVS